MWPWLNLAIQIFGLICAAVGGFNFGRMYVWRQLRREAEELSSEIEALSEHYARRERAPWN